MRKVTVEFTHHSSPYYPVSRIFGRSIHGGMSYSKFILHKQCCKMRRNILTYCMWQQAETKIGFREMSAINDLGIVRSYNKLKQAYGRTEKTFVTGEYRKVDREELFFLAMQRYK